MEKISVIIVDDHTLIRETWSFLLNRSENFIITAECADGQEAIKNAIEARPEIILLDINMAPMNGFDIIQELNKYAPGSKVIAVTLHTQPVYAKKILKLGGKGYITKNSPRRELLEGIIEVHKGGNYICSEMKNILAEQTFCEESIFRNGVNSLSAREVEVVHLLKDGFSSKEIAQELHISHKTVERHRHHVMKKLGTKNTAAIINLINTTGI